MRYYINNYGQPIFLGDIRKAIEWDPLHPSRITHIEAHKAETSEELRGYLRKKYVLDVTEEYEAQIAEEQQQRVAQYNSQPSQAPVDNRVFSGGEQRAQAFQVPRTQSIMVDESEGSRVLGASDAAAHTAHLQAGIRRGAETSIIVDNYDDPNMRAIAEKSRTSFLVDDDSRARHQVDPRMVRNQQMLHNPMAGPLPPEFAPTARPHSHSAYAPPQPPANVPMSHLYQNASASRIQNYEHTHGADHKHDPNWGSHSALLAARRASNPVHGRPHDHAFNNNVGMEPLDPRIQANHSRTMDPGINPAIAATAVMGDNQLPSSNPLLNPAFDSLFAPLPSEVKPNVNVEDDGEIPVNEIATKTVQASPKKPKGKAKKPVPVAKGRGPKKKLTAAIA
jgi:hypothetical protein